jgi:hypothetical protein
MNLLPLLLVICYLTTILHSNWDLGRGRAVLYLHAANTLLLSCGYNIRKSIWRLIPTRLWENSVEWKWLNYVNIFY